MLRRCLTSASPRALKASQVRSAGTSTSRPWRGAFRGAAGVPGVPDDVPDVPPNGVPDDAPATGLRRGDAATMPNERIPSGPQSQPGAFSRHVHLPWRGAFRGAPGVPDDVPDVPPNGVPNDAPTTGLRRCSGNRVATGLRRGCDGVAPTHQDVPPTMLRRRPLNAPPVPTDPLGTHPHGAQAGQVRPAGTSTRRLRRGAFSCRGPQRCSPDDVGRSRRWSRRWFRRSAMFPNARRCRLPGYKAIRMPLAARPPSSTRLSQVQSGASMAPAGEAGHADGTWPRFSARLP